MMKLQSKSFMVILFACFCYSHSDTDRRCHIQEAPPQKKQISPLIKVAESGISIPIHAFCFAMDYPTILRVTSDFRQEWQFRKLLQHLSRCQRKFTGTLIQPVDQGGILFQQGRYLPIVGQKLS